MKRIAALVVLFMLVAGCMPVQEATPNVVVVTSPPVEVTREVQVTRVTAMGTKEYQEAQTAVAKIWATEMAKPVATATAPAVQFTNLTWTRDVAVPRICVNQGVAFKMVLEGKPGLDVAYHINHYDSAGVKAYRSNDFAGTIEADGRLVKTFQESFPYQSKWTAQLVITWPLPLITRNANVTVDCD